MTKCLSCGNQIEAFMSFGQMPIANGFLLQEDFDQEYFFEMEVGFCPECYMFQLMNQPEREKMFNEHYAFFSGTSQYMGVHFKEFAESVIAEHLADKDDPFVVEIGSNDGIMLKNFAWKNIRHLGVEPSANVARKAIAKGVDTIIEFFDRDCAEKIVSKHGQADTFLAANVMCHIPYMHSIIEGIKVLLKDDGVVIFEDPYLGDVIDCTAYSQIYHDHMFLFSALSIQNVFAQHEMELIDVIHQGTHGGSMRYVVAHKGKKDISKNVYDLIEKERKIGLDNSATFDRFRENCESSREKLTKIIRDIRAKGHRIVGYAAAAKSTTILNYCGLTADDIEYISDTTPIKQGKYSPGAHIPIKPYEEFKNDYPPYALLFAYNHYDEVMEKEQDYMNSGGKWIVYSPKIKVI